MAEKLTLAAALGGAVSRYLRTGKDMSVTRAIAEVRPNKSPRPVRSGIQRRSVPAGR